MSIYKTFTFATSGNKDLLKTIVKKDHLLPKKNLSYERFTYFTRKKSDGESIEQFVIDLKNKARSCEFGDLKESLIKDIMTCGLRSRNHREKLLQENEITLEDAVKMCLAVEKSREQSSQISDFIGIGTSIAMDGNVKEPIARKQRNLLQVRKCSRKKSEGSVERAGCKIILRKCVARKI
ncbi:hypothetical protein JTB14_038284 [Gonioctena quinquepunctata]|nr:hypothetical protein JTB14_038284 [Gonioctena quinquepunctata]